MIISTVVNSGELRNLGYHLDAANVYSDPREAICFLAKGMEQGYVLNKTLDQITAAGVICREPELMLMLEIQSPLGILNDYDLITISGSADDMRAVYDCIFYADTLYREVGSLFAPGVRKNAKKAHPLLNEYLISLLWTMPSSWPAPYWLKAAMMHAVGLGNTAIFESVLSNPTVRFEDILAMAQLVREGVSDYAVLTALRPPSKQDITRF